MRKFAVFALLLCGGLFMAGCDTKLPGDTTAAPTAGKEYWVNKSADGCTVDPAKGETVVAGPFATRDNAKAEKAANAACKKVEAAPAAP
jgi:hypothetical protein